MKRIFWFILLSLSLDAFSDTAHLNTTLHKAKCKTNIQCKIPSIHHVEIINYSDKAHGYTLFNSICVNEFKCHIIISELTLQPHTGVDNNYNNWIYYKFTVPGVYHAIAVTEIRGHQHMYNLNESTIMVNKK